MFKALLVRDIKTALSDKQALLTLIIMPIVLVTILSFALQDMFTEEFPVSQTQLGVVFDFDERPVSQILSESAAALVMSQDQLQAFDTLEQLDVKALIMDDFLLHQDLAEVISARLISKQEGLDAVKSKDLDAVVIFDQAFYNGFYLNMATPLKNPAPISIVANNDNYLKRDILEAIFEGFSSQMTTSWQAKNLVLQLTMQGQGQLTTPDLSTLLEKVFSNGQGVELDIQSQTLPGTRLVTSSDYYTMAMLSMFLLFTAGYGSRLMLEEKQAYTLQRLKMAGMSKWPYLISKLVLMCFLGYVQLAGMIVFSALVLKVNWGNPLSLLIVASAAIFAVAGMGLMIAVYTVTAGNYKVANMLETFIFQIMAFLGGSFIPLKVLPGFFSYLSKLTINGLAMQGFMFNMQGVALRIYFENVVILMGMGLVFSGLALWGFRERRAGHEGTPMA